MSPDNKALLSELACALTYKDTISFGATHFVDLTNGKIVFIPDEYQIEKISPDRLAKYRDWEKDCIRTYLEHDLIAIEPVPTRDSFHVMEKFVETRSHHEQQKLIMALNRKHPFSNFKYAAEELAILQQWYDFKNEADGQMAEKWLKENDLTIDEGKIVRNDKRMKVLLQRQ